MKRLTLFILAAQLITAFNLEAKKPVRITVLSYNIQIGKRMPIEKYAEFIRRYNPDLVAFQELDYMTGRADKPDLLGEVAEATGMYPVYSAAMAHMGGQYGIGLMSRFPILAVQDFALPQPEGSYEPRRAVSIVAQVIPGVKMRFTSTHLDLPSDDIRLGQVKALDGWLSRDDMPSVLCGDFNAKPDSRTIGYMNSLWKRVCDDGFTFPETAPNIKIDYIFVKGGGKWKVIDYKVLEDVPLSDHCPILATLEYTPQDK